MWCSRGLKNLKNTIIYLYSDLHPFLRVIDLGQIDHSKTYMWQNSPFLKTHWVFACTYCSKNQLSKKALLTFCKIERNDLFSSCYRTVIFNYFFFHTLSGLFGVGFMSPPPPFDILCLSCAISDVKPHPFISNPPPFNIFVHVLFSSPLSPCPRQSFAKV